MAESDEIMDIDVLPSNNSFSSKAHDTNSHVKSRKLDPLGILETKDPLKLQKNTPSQRTHVGLGIPLHSEALHLHWGLDGLTDPPTTAEINSNYFFGFLPKAVEWTSKDACNVIFEDEFSAKKAFLALSTAPMVEEDHEKMETEAPWYHGKTYQKDLLEIPVYIRIASAADFSTPSNDKKEKMERTSSFKGRNKDMEEAFDVNDHPLSFSNHSSFNRRGFTTAKAHFDLDAWKGDDFGVMLEPPVAAVSDQIQWVNSNDFSYESYIPDRQKTSRTMDRSRRVNSNIWFDPDLHVMAEERKEEEEAVRVQERVEKNRKRPLHYASHSDKPTDLRQLLKPKREREKGVDDVTKPEDCNDLRERLCKGKDSSRKMKSTYQWVGTSVKSDDLLNEVKKSATVKKGRGFVPSNTRIVKDDGRDLDSRAKGEEDHGDVLRKDLRTFLDRKGASSWTEKVNVIKTDV